MSRLENYNYWNDARVVASLCSPMYKVTPHGGGRVAVTFTDYIAESLQERALLPEGSSTLIVEAEFELCGMCSGSGSVVNPSIDCCGIVEDDFRDDREFEADYFAGAFDIQCPECAGLRVNSRPVFPDAVALEVAEWEEAEWEHAQEVAAERRMGC
jgi:hypothetical protein